MNDPAPKNRTILLIEDNPDHQERTRLALKDHHPGVEVICASSGAAALHLLDKKQIDGVIIDESLPDMDSLHLLAKIKLRPQPPPAIVVTDNANERMAVESMKRGATDYLPKNSEAAVALPLLVDRAIDTAELEERVRTTERQYRDLIEASNDAIYILVGNRFHYVNQRFSEYFGWSQADLTDEGFDYRSLIAEESRPLIEERNRRVRENQPLPSRYEFKANRRDGSSFDVEVSVSYIRYAGQSAVLGILQDITARKAYETTLLRKNHELSVLNAVAEAITQVRDLSAILDGVVERLIELLEVDAAGIAILESDGARFRSVHYRGASETFVREMRTRDPNEGVIGLALKTQELQILEEIQADERIQHGAAVREGFQSAVALPLISHNRCTGVITVFTRERRAFVQEDVNLFVAVARQIAVAIENAHLYEKAREGIDRLQALSEIARAIGSTLDVEGVFRIVGDRLRTLIPYRRISLNILRRDSRHFSVRTIDSPRAGEPPAVRLHEPLEVDSPFLEALETQDTLVVEPGGMLAESHSAYPKENCRTALVPVVADNMAMGVLVLASEDTHGFRERDLDLLRDLAAHMAISLKNANVFQDLERAYRDLRDAKDRLVRSEKLQSLGEMAAGVAHDFNNVLSAILGRAQMLKVMLSNEEMLKSVRVIEKAALDGAGTVRRIQEFAKEKSEGNFHRVHLNPLVRDAVDLTTTRVNDMGIGIEMQVELGEVGTVLGNATELREVLTNLIFNAIDAMPHGGRLSVRSGTDWGVHQSWFEVEDTGIGMDEETQNRIFDPFYTTKGTRGTGLGLSVSYGIIQRHKGEVTVQSEKGIGSVLRVLFPPSEESGSFTPDLPPPEQPSETPEKPKESQIRARILLIDDDVAVRDVLADILRTDNHHVEGVSSGEQGLELFESEGFDIVFTDLGMPGINGWEVATGIKSMSPKTPVGLITGWGASLDESRLSERNVDIIVSKPFRYNQVLEVVAEAISLLNRVKNP